MALASLRYQRNAQGYEESRQGMTVFAGDAASFHEWQFRLQIKKSLCTAEELPVLTAKVIDALRGEALSCAMEIGLAKLMEANGLDLLVQKVQERLFPQQTAEARELLKQGMRIGGPMSRVPGEPMTSYISRRRRWWTLVHEMDNTLELGDTVQGSMMLEQAGLSRFEQNMVLTYTKGQRTMTAIAEALLEQHYDVHHRGRETPTPTGNPSSPNRWRRRDTTRAYLAEVEPIKELTDTAAYGEEGIPDDYDGEQDETEDDDNHETDLAALLGNSGDDPRGGRTLLAEDIMQLSASQSGATTQSKAFVAYCSNNTELQNAFVSQPPQLLAAQTLVMAVDADGNEIGQRCDQSLDSPFDPCQGQSDSLSVSLQEPQVTSSDPLRGQTATPCVSAQQIDSDDEETAYFAGESFVIDQEHDERIWATLDEGCNAACHTASWAARAERYFDMFGFQSEYRAGTRNKVFTGLGGNTVAAVGRRKFPFALAFTAERGDIHHLTGTIESWELPGDGPFLFPIDAQAK